MVARDPGRMTPVYRGLRWMFQVAVELFYVDVRLTGRQHLPEEGPVVFVANHPNSLMDTVVLGTQVDRQIHYLAKSELFRSRAVAWLFDQCGVIPLHRNPEGEHDNREAFESAYDLLDDGGCLGIFPEGQNSEDRRLLEVKTGAARIALGAESRCDYELGVSIVPVGLNYERRDRFMTRVVARVGEPIDAGQYGGRHREDERAAVRGLTDAIASSLDRVVAVIRDERVRNLTEQIDDIYGRGMLEEAAASDDASDGGKPEGESGKNDDQRRGFRKALLDRLKQSRGDDARDFDRRLAAQERLAEALEYYDSHHPDLLERLQVRVQSYVDHVEQLRIRGELEKADPGAVSTRLEALKLTAYAILFAIPAAWGILNNAVPFFLARGAAARAPDEPRRAFVGLLAGALFFTAAYTLQCWGIYAWTSAGWPTTLAYLASLPAAGFFFLRYRRTVSKFRSRILVRTLFRTNRNLVNTLLAERKELVGVFEDLGRHYEEARSARERDEDPPPPPEFSASVPLAMRLDS